MTDGCVCNWIFLQACITKKQCTNVAYHHTKNILVGLQNNLQQYNYYLQATWYALKCITSHNETENETRVLDLRPNLNQRNIT